MTSSEKLTRPTYPHIFFKNKTKDYQDNQELVFLKIKNQNDSNSIVSFFLRALSENKLRKFGMFAAWTIFFIILIKPYFCR